MRNNIIKLIAVALLTVPTVAMAQRVQPLPEEVNEVRIDGHKKLRVLQGEESRLATYSESKNIARVSRNRMTINASDQDVILELAPGRSISIHAEDYATVELNGSFAMCDVLTVETEDYATAHFIGTTADTIRCQMISLQSSDFSRITSDVILKHFEYEFAASDYSRIELAGIDQMTSTEEREFTNRTSVSDFGKVYKGRITIAGVLQGEDNATADHDYTTVINGMTDRLADMARNESTATQKPKKKNHWYSGDGDIDFGWGWHNWGNNMFSGFGGVDGAAEVSTSFNNIHLAGKWHVIGNRWFGLYAGLGLEWDRWKFTTPHVELGTSTDPYSFAAATPAIGSTILTTRYVNIPLSIRIGDEDEMHLMLTALPGIHWNASGLRYKQHDSNREATVKDRSINSHINPYKLDLRAELRFNVVGIYVQVSTLSLFRQGVEELYPVKFGIIL